MVRNILLLVKKVFDKPLIIVGGITLFGAIIRFYHLGFKPLWLDEAVLYWISNSGNLKNIIIQNALHNSAPPLFAVLISITMRLGDSEKILRLIPWLSGVAAIPAVYFLSRQFLERIPAYFSTLIVTIALTQVEYSQQLREYSLTFLISTIILALFYKQFRQPSWMNLILMTLSMVIGIFLQYGLALLIIALNGVFLVILFSSRPNRKLLTQRWLIAQSVVLCAVASVYYLSLKQQMIVGFGATSKSTYLSSGYWNGSMTSLFHFAFSATHNILHFAFPGAFFLFFVVIGFIFALMDKNYRIALMMVVFPMGLTLVASLAKLYPYIGFRQDMFLTPMIYVLFGFGLSYLINVIKQQWIVSLLLIFVIGMGFPGTYNYLNYAGDENLKPIVTALSNSYENDDIIYVYYGAKPAFTYYYQEHKDSQVFGKSSRGNPAGYFQDIDKILSSNYRIWIVFSHCYSDECQIIPNYFSNFRKVDLVASDNGTALYLAR